MNGWIYVIGFAAACVLAIILTPIMKKLAFWVGAVSVPNHRSVHTKPMPLLGGLAIFFAFVGSYFVVMPAADVTDKDHIGLGLILGGSTIALVGALDDRLNLSPKLKLLGQLIAAIVVVSFGLEIDVVNIPFGDSISIEQNWISYPLTIIWIIAITNAINLIDGLDGLSAGVSSIAAGTILVMALMMANPNAMVILLCAILIGSSLGFLIFNFHPAKIFMGDSGSLFLGFALSILSIMGYKQATIVSFLVPILVLGVPISDTLLAIVRRKLNKKPISVADKGHLHHCLMDLGFGMRKTVLIIYGIAIVFGACAVLMTQDQSWVTIVITVIVLLLLEVGAEAIGIISKTRKPVLQFLTRLRDAIAANR
ncbi:MraY family glycosyltransferase [Paenibacillus aurantius]|uniref:MraY family glycosyltransferase n=1 Tax=Paenibacillus aurantius TaxID=2918900 RepID=A0AA96LE83_9BACL|nr:MraY family glycosyltransferase [Paenibacillus aurantius]WNQ11584.1 MraY family glycosyltransferase [Paenibacillus aurantius]